MNNTNEKYYNRFNIGQIVRIDSTSKYLVHIGFGGLKYFYSSGRIINVGDFIVFTPQKNNEIEFIDRLENYKYLSDVEAYPWNDRNDIDYSSLPSKCICKNKSFSGYAYGGKSFVILQKNDTSDEIEYNRLQPSYETHLWLNYLYADKEIELLEESAFTDAIQWATEVVEKYDFNEALNSLKVGIRSHSVGVCHDHSGEYITHSFLYLDYLHHNKKSSYFGYREIHDPYLETVIFPDLHIELSQTNERDSTNNQYVNADQCKQFAESIEQEIREKAKKKYNKLNHINTLAYTRIGKLIERNKETNDKINVNKTLAKICWGLYMFKDEGIVPNDTIRQYNLLFETKENSLWETEDILLDVNSVDIENCIKKMRGIHNKIRKTILRDFLNLEDDFQDTFIDEAHPVRVHKRCPDYETAIMSALKNGYGDAFGFE